MASRIDVHAHLIPGVDDGCHGVAQAVQCARRFVEAGYSHAFCTPHVWSSLPANRVESIAKWTSELQRELDQERVSLKLVPGGEINILDFWPRLERLPREQIVTCAMRGRFVLFDFWAKHIDDCRPRIDAAMDHLQSLDFIPILAHPERIEALQRDPAYIDELISRGVRLQLNTWCIAEPEDSPIYQLATRLLIGGKYFVAGTDCHGPSGMDKRLAGLEVIRRLTDDAELDRLTIKNPRELLGE